MSFSHEDVLHVAKLARLHVSEEDIEMYKNDLGAIISYIDTLQELDTENVPEFQHAAGGTNVFRSDDVQGCEEATRQRILENFSSREGDLLQVQAVFTNRD